LDDLSEECSTLPNAEIALEPIADLKPTEFWQKLKLVKNGLGKPKFPLLAELMTNLLALPHSTACVERIFSQVNRVKTKQTNRLHLSTVANRLLAKQAIPRSGEVCCSWKPTQSLIKAVMDKAPHQRYIETIKENSAAESDGIPYDSVL